MRWWERSRQTSPGNARTRSPDGASPGRGIRAAQHRGPSSHAFAWRAENYEQAAPRVPLRQDAGANAVVAQAALALPIPMAN